MSLRLIADANAQTTVALAITAGATSIVGGATANFPIPQNFGNGIATLTILDSGNPAYNAAAPFATPFEYASYTTNTVGTNTLSGLTRGVNGTTAHAFFAGATIAVGYYAEDILASAPWKFDEQTPSAVATLTIPSSGTIPASYLGINWRHIEIEYDVITSSANPADVLFMRFNGDVGNNYDYNQAAYAGTAWTVGPATTTTSAIRVGVANGGAGVANSANRGKIKIIDAFEALFRKQIGAECYRNDGTNFGIDFSNGDWHPVTPVAISSITFFCNGNPNFAAGSRFTTRLLP